MIHFQICIEQKIEGTNHRVHGVFKIGNIKHAIQIHQGTAANWSKALDQGFSLFVTMGSNCSTARNLFMVGFYDLKGLFQPNLFCDSTMLSLNIYQSKYHSLCDQAA